MRRTTILLATAFTGVLLVAGCSSEGGGDKPAATPSTPSEAASAAESTDPSPVKLSTEWGPKLDAADEDAPDGVCREVGAPQCVEHITKLTELVYDVQDAIDTAGATAAYPKTVQAIQDVEDASGAYAEGGCAGSTDGTLDEGSVCGGYVATLLLGPATLSMTMITDELTAS